MKAGSTIFTTSSNLRIRLLFLLFVAALVGSLSAAGQKEKKKKDHDQKNASAETQVTLPDNQAIDVAISEMLASWQLGDLERLHKYYADDVVVVSGAWEPPLVGWANYSQAYQRQRERMQGGRLERSNTLISLKGNMGWATYQWEFGATVDGQATSARGQSTLVLEKRQDRWVIIVNHTSVLPELNAPAPQASPQKSTSPPPAGSGI